MKKPLSLNSAFVVLCLSGGCLFLNSGAHAQTVPVAMPDYEVFGPDQTGGQGAPGILQNDLLTPGATAVLVGQPAHGTVTLNTDGSWSFTPNTGFRGADAFKYLIIDGQGVQSNVSTVNLAVGACTDIQFDRTYIPGGQNANGTAVLNWYTENPAVVTLKSSSSRASVPANVTVAAGQYTGAFPITTTTGSSTVSVNISATLNGYTTVRSILVSAATPDHLDISPGSVTGAGNAVVTATVYLTTASPTGGTVVAIKSADATVATVPSSITIPAGATSGSFKIAHKGVSVNRDIAITVTARSVSRRAYLQLTPYNVYFDSVRNSSTFLHITGIDGIVGCLDPSGVFNTSTIALRLDSPAPTGGLTVQLTYNDQVGGLVAPASFTFPAGSSRGTFHVSIRGYTPDQKGLGIVASYLHENDFRAINIYPVQPLLSLPSGSHEYGGSRFPINADLIGFPPSTGAAVTLASSSAFVVTPAAMSFPPGQNHGSFYVQSKPVATSQPVTVTASYNGYSSAATFVLFPAQVADIFLDSYEVKGGTDVMAAITLSGPTAASTVITIDSFPVGLVTPTTITVAAGARGTVATLKTKVVSSTTGVWIRAYTWSNPSWGGSSTYLTLDP
jgi:hypothetical protein